ncbi:hypothetical protein, partial [Microcoleus sp. CAWBG58]|uniref:hypothetical protein n=1 Tax=Microcoleus sp. CAWBG58 TaxID=2841651 RepID=UPI0025FF5E60
SSSQKSTYPVCRFIYHKLLRASIAWFRGLQKGESGRGGEGENGRIFLFPLTDNYQLSTDNYQLSTINCQLLTDFCKSICGKMARRRQMWFVI